MKLVIYDLNCWGFSSMMPVVDEALRRLNLPNEIDVIYDENLMRKIGLKFTPALEINGEIIYEGKFPGVKEMCEKFKSYSTK